MASLLDAPRAARHEFDVTSSSLMYLTTTYYYKDIPGLDSIPENRLDDGRVSA